MTDLSRRRFLQSAGGAVAALSAAGIAHATTKAPKKWEETVDFLVIGTGFAGLAAAIEGHEKGIKNILVVDKMPIPGGNSAINGGGIAAAGTDMQQKLGIKDSTELLYNDILRAGGGLAHPELARQIADNSLENFYWLRDKVGVKFHAVYFHGGHSVKRSHQCSANMGSGFIQPMLAKLEEYNVPVRTQTYVNQFITDENGAVLGVRVRNDWDFGEETSGTESYIRTTKGVLIASGGFARNVKMRMSHDPRLTSAFGSTNQPGATGEMIQQAQMIGANTVQMDWIQLGPWTSPDEEGFGKAPRMVEALVGYGPMIDPATGKRFIKETGNRKVRADAIVKIGHPTLIYSSEEHVKKNVIGVNMREDELKELINRNVVRVFKDLKALADFYKINYKTLKAENDKFNGYMKRRKDPEFECQFFEDSTPNVKGPFYVVRLWPRVHHCMGGLEINAKAQVLNACGEVIPNLYAAGEATGGVHGMVRLGTVAVADCTIFGRIAARNVASS